MPRSNATIDSTGKRKSFRRLVSRFAEKTSMQGVPYINMAKLWWAKVIWSVLLLAAVGVMFLHLWYLFDQWYGFPKTTTITLGFDDLPLPQVTICNTNIMHKTRLNNIEGGPQLRKLVNDLLPTNLVPGQFDDNYQVPTTTTTTTSRATTSKTTARRTNRPRGRNITTTSATQGNTNTTTRGPRGTRNSTRTTTTQQPNVRKKRALGYESLNITEYVDSFRTVETEDGDFSSDVDTFVLLQQAVTDLYMDLNKKEREYLGHQIKDMLVGCTFNGKTCTAKMFKLHQTSEYGNCWTVSNDGFNVRTAGPTGGLSIVLFLETNEYLQGITTGFGARVLLQEKNTYPFPQHEGLFVPASMETDIGLKMVTVNRLGGRHGSCNDGIAFNESNGVTYTRRACQSFCRDSTIINSCSCFDDKSEEFAVKKNKTLKPCRSKEEVKCLHKVNRALIRGGVTCTCDIPCNEVSYSKTLSMRQWPSDEYARVLLEWVCQRDTTSCVKLRNKLSNMRELSSNFLKLNIYYEDLNFEEITETPQIELQQFLSDVGGAVGLWIGLSMLSLCELLQLFVELIDYCVHKSRPSGRRNGSNQDNEDNNHHKSYDNDSRDDKGYDNDHRDHTSYDNDPRDDRNHRNARDSPNMRLHDRNYLNITPRGSPGQLRRHDKYFPGRPRQRDYDETDFMDRSREHPRHHSPYDDRYVRDHWRR